MALRKMRYEGDDILRKKSKPVKEVNKKIRDLIDDMIETMYASNGVGIAAPQVGILKRIIVVSINDEIFALINPEIIEANGEQEGTEGCLSIPGKRGVVIRPSTIKVKALNQDGEEIIIEGEERAAVVLSHEIDHLEGVLYTDKVIRMENDNEDDEYYEDDEYEE